MTASEPDALAALGLEEALRRMQDAVMIVEAPAGRLRLANARAREMTALWVGHDRDPDLAREATIFRSDGTPYRRAEWPLMRALRGEETVDEEFWHVLADGHRLTYSADCSPIRDGAGRVVAAVAIVRDITAQRWTDLELERRAGQQASVAALGLRALEGDDLDALLDEAVELVARTLEVELTAVEQVVPGREQLLLRAGVGWRRGLVGTVTASTGPETLTGRALRRGEPVVGDSLLTETRFRVLASVAEHGATSGMVVVIGGRDEPFGALAAYATERRSFSPDDVNFVQSVANVLAAAAECSQADARLVEGREAERERIGRDLHDEVLHELGDALAKATASDVATAHSRPATLVPALGRVVQQVRGAIYELRLDGEEDRPFRQRLAALGEAQRARGDGLDVPVELRDGVPDIPLGRTGTEVLRVLGEALTNARPHGRADRVVARVSGSKARLWGDVSDDGQGFEASARSVARGSGIAGMRERVDVFDADLDLRSEPGARTTLRVEVPLAAGGEPGIESVRVLLVEDHAVVRQAIAAAFERDAGFTVAGQAGSLAEAHGLLQDVDVAVLDLALPDGNGADLIEDLRRANPRAQALVLSGTLDRREIACAVDRGAAAVLNKTTPLNEIVQAVRRLRAGERLMPVEEIVALLRYAGRERERDHADRQAIANLTPREREILRTLADGLDTQTAAERLHISVRTQRNHMSNILAKLGVHSQLQALVFALRYEIVDVSQPPRAELPSRAAAHRAAPAE